MSIRSIRLSAVLSAVSSAVGIAKAEALAKEEDVFAKADQPVNRSISVKNPSYR